MLLIATDEAGYGPKLGPLVIAATVWRLPAKHALRSLETLATPCRFPGLPKLSIADSKTIFRPHHSSRLAGLEAIVWAASQWVWPTETALRLDDWLHSTSRHDIERLRKIRWFAANQLQQPFPISTPLQPLAAEVAATLQQTWTARGAELIDIRQRVLDAKQFNQRCGQGINKAQLLSETTTALVVELLDQHPGDDVAVYCDRHGGRAYYGALLQHGLPAATMQVFEESSRESRYALSIKERRIEWRFTVKGDAFGPVSCASICAKYTRERLMDCFNAYWQSKHAGQLGPTAGYPGDANRFLAELQATLEREQVEWDDLVRSR